jgi:hypothetical protein
LALAFEIGATNRFLDTPSQEQQFNNRDLGMPAELNEVPLEKVDPRLSFPPKSKSSLLARSCRLPDRVKKSLIKRKNPVTI